MAAEADPGVLGEDAGAQSWQPLSTRLGGPPIDETWHEGIPPWIYGPVCDWVDLNLIINGNSEFLFARLRFQGELEFGKSLARTLNEADLLDWIDGLLYLNAERSSFMASEAYKLEALLREGYSLWRVSDNENSLERRQDETVTTAVRQVVLTAERVGRPAAAKHLQNAWAKTYGLHPEPSKAYAEAILAVEAVAVPAVVPRHADATLGHVYGQLKNQGSLYELSILDKATGDCASAEAVTQLIGLLWKGHTDRHEGNVPASPITQGAAEMAVHAAAALVQWFASGAIRRKSRLALGAASVTCD